MLERGYIILIVGAIMFFSGIIISIVWASSFFNAFLSQTVFLADISIPPSSSVNNTLQINDLEHPILLQVHFENNDGDDDNNDTTTQIREIVLDPNGNILSQNNISKEFSTTVKPSIQGKYTLSLHNYGNVPASIGGAFGSVQFMNQNNQVSFGLFSGVIVGAILIVLGILTLLIGLIVAIMDRRK